MKCNCIEKTKERLKTRILEPDMNPPKGAKLNRVLCQNMALMLSAAECGLSIPFTAVWDTTSKSGEAKAKETTIRMIASHCPFCGKKTEE